MPFGLATAPATFMRLMTLVFSGMLYTTCPAYLDDIIVFGRNYIEMLNRLDTALERLEQANLKLRPSKCAFGKTSVIFLGHVITDKGISTDPEKLSRIQEWPRPHNTDEARSFLRYATYYRKFIRNFAHTVEPLNKLLQNERQFYWSADCESSFKTIKAAFKDTITLSYPDFTKPFIVDYDAHGFGIGGVLSQVIRPGVEQPVSYFSRTLSKPERKYAVTRKEMLALVDSLRHFRCYIFGRKLKVRTDHSDLQWLKTFKEPVGQVARWIERLTEYDVDIEHRPGKEHANADALSRYPVCVSAVFVPEIWFPPEFKTEYVKQQAHDPITSALLTWCKKTALATTNNLKENRRKTCCTTGRGLMSSPSKTAFSACALQSATDPRLRFAQLSLAQLGRRYSSSLTEVESVLTSEFRRPSKILGRDFTG